MKEAQVEIHGSRRFSLVHLVCSKEKTFPWDTDAGQEGRALGEAQPPRSGQKREFCGCPVAVSAWDARKGWELASSMWSSTQH